MEKDKQLEIEELFYKIKEIRQYIANLNRKTEEYKKLENFLLEIQNKYKELSGK